MAARLNLQGHFERQGMYAFAADQALRLLERLLAHRPVQMAVIAADWSQLNRTRSRPNTGLLSGLLVEAGATAAAAPAAIDESLLLSSDPAEQLAQITATIRDLTAQVLRLKPERLPADQPLIYLGMDSIMAVELNNRIKTNLGLTLSLSDLLMGSSVTQLAEKLVNQLWRNQELNALLDEVEQLSADELEMLLVSAGQP
jgi:acyl carrier protein